MNNSFFRLVVLLLLIPLALNAQKQKSERAYAAFQAGTYYEAIDLFKDVYSKTRDKQIKAEMVFMVSECYRLVNDPKNAELVARLTEQWLKGWQGAKSAHSKPQP